MHDPKLNFFTTKALPYIAHPHSPKAKHPNATQNSNQLMLNATQTMKNAKPKFITYKQQTT
jgi:hypothetical protein